MDSFDNFTPVFDAIRAAQSRYPDGDALDAGRLREELDQIYEQHGGNAEEGSFEWYFHTANHRSYLSYKLRNRKTGLKPSVPMQPTQLILHLGSICKAKRPLSSKFCRGMALSYLNQALRVHESDWLKEKGMIGENPIGALRKRRLKPADHGRIRALISDRLIPAIFHQRREGNAAKTWKRSLVLDLADLFARYAPPKRYDDLGIAALPAGPETLFIKFLSNALAYFDPDIGSNNEALAKFWQDQKKIMLGRQDQDRDSNSSF